jgi:DNA-binding NarL/FixJ family response regulator
MTVRARVLLADDHPLVMEGLKGVLTPRFDVLETLADGHDLLARARELRPNVIVTDISMPRLGGFEVLAELQKTDPLIRVVVLTMHDEPGYARRALALGAAAFVSKHAAPAELIAAIESALAGETYLSSNVTASMRAEQVTEEAASVLSPRQRDVLRLLGQGRSVKATAAELGISTRTVEFHKYQMMHLLGVRTSAELICYAHRMSLPES